MEKLINKMKEDIQQLSDLPNEDIEKLVELREVLNEVIAIERSKTEDPNDPLVYS